MSRAIAFVFLFSCSLAHARPDWAAGTGIEARMQREVNPDYAETRVLPQLFVQMRFVNWGAHLEAGTEKSSSESGALRIDSRSHNAGIWGRYSFLEQKRWRPFLGLGTGCYFDSVKSEFGAATNESTGIRPYLGTSGGISAVFWNHMLIEAELRGNLVRERKEPLFAALLRIGFQL